MPFRPLPTSFTDHLAHLDPARDFVLELGSGEGRFAEMIAACCPAPVVGMDRIAWPDARHLALRGDARHVPLRRHSVAVVVAANLVRHLAPRRELGTWVAAWRDLLRPGGCLYVLEDAPGAESPARRHYAEVQDLLARLMPTERGPLLRARRFAELVADATPAAAWTWGEEDNATPVDAGAVMRMLSSGQGADSGPVAGLIRRIGRDGIAPGRYWWGRLAADAEEES